MSEYSPIDPNPYIVGNPIKSEKLFYGRKDDFNFVRKKFSSKINQIVVLSGQRRSGKTSILFQILNGRIGPDFLPILIDLQSMAGIRSNADFYTRLYKEINENTENIYITPPAIKSEEDEHEWVDYFRKLLDTVSEKTGGKSVLLLFDEYEIIELMIDSGNITANVVMLIAALIEGRNKVGLVFTGSMHLEDRTEPYWNHLLSKAISRRISFLTERDTKRLCSEPIAGKVKYRGNALALIYRLTAGQPFYTQVVCQNLVDLLNEKQKNIVTIEILNEIIEEIVNNPLPQMIYFWDSLDDNEKVVLSLMSVSLTDDQETIIPAKIHRSISKQKYNIFISLSTINETFEKLFQNDLLAKPAQDEYNFRVDLFRHWIKYEHSVWQVVREISDSFRRPIVRPVIWYMSAIVLLMGLLGYFLFYQGFPQPKEKINNAKPMHYSAMIISNIGGVQVSLDSAKYITYTEGTIRFDSLQIGLHHADIYPPDSTWEPDRKRLKMFIKKEMQIFRVDFSKRSEELLISEIPEATLENKSKQIQHSKGSISLVSIPLGAKIYIEDEYKGETPFTLQSMTPGYHQFLLRKVGYSDVIKVIEIVADSIVLLNETLLELQGQLSVTVTGTWANIEIDGISYGRTPRRDPIILRAGIVEVKLLNPAYKPLTRSIEIAPEKEFKLVVDKKMFSDF